MISTKAEAHAAIRTLLAAKAAAEEDFSAALVREERERWAEFEAKFQAVLKQRNELGEEISRTIGAFAGQLLKLRDVSMQAVALMNRGKREVPQDKRKAVLVMESLHAMANPSMLQRWADIAIRRHLGTLWETDVGEQMQPFEESVRATSTQAHLIDRIWSSWGIPDECIRVKLSTPTWGLEFGSWELGVGS